jgi:hypothetical protein
MIESIIITDVDPSYEHLSFPYRAYKQWQDEEPDLPDPFHYTGSCTAKVRPRTEWNTLGREIYDIEDVERHAGVVSRMLRDLGMTAFLIQQTMPASAWFRGRTQDLKGRASDMLAYLRSRGVSVDFVHWRGAFIVREEIGDFLNSFLDYSFTLNTYDLEVFSFQEPLAMVLDHHLCVEYISSDPALVERLRTRICSEGILEYPERGTGGHA